MRIPVADRYVRLAVLSLMLISAAVVVAASQSFTLEQIKSYPFPNELTASASGARIAWAFSSLLKSVKGSLRNSVGILTSH